MPSRHEIKCVNKTDRYNPHERIRAIGGQNPDGTLWKLTQEEAIQGIEVGHKYLKTEADGEHPNNLLSLYECS